MQRGCKGFKCEAKMCVTDEEQLKHTRYSWICKKKKIKSSQNYKWQVNWVKISVWNANPTPHTSPPKLLCRSCRFLFTSFRIKQISIQPNEACRDLFHTKPYLTWKCEQNLFFWLLPPYVENIQFLGTFALFYSYLLNLACSLIKIRQNSVAKIRQVL